MFSFDWVNYEPTEYYFEFVEDLYERWILNDEQYEEFKNWWTFEDLEDLLWEKIHDLLNEFIDEKYTEANEQFRSVMHKHFSDEIYYSTHTWELWKVKDLESIQSTLGIDTLDDASILVNYDWTISVDYNWEERRLIPFNLLSLDFDDDYFIEVAETYWIDVDKDSLDIEELKSKLLSKVDYF